MARLVRDGSGLTNSRTRGHARANPSPFEQISCASTLRLGR